MVMTDYYAKSRVLFETNLTNAFFISSDHAHAIHANSYPSTISGLLLACDEDDKGDVGELEITQDCSVNLRDQVTIRLLVLDAT